MKTEICSFSGFKIYPGKGKLYVRGDSKVFLRLFYLDEIYCFCTDNVHLDFYELGKKS
jgi:hypothetical protein